MKSTFRHLSYLISAAILCVGSSAVAQKTSDYLIVNDLPFIKEPTDFAGYLSGLFQLGIGIAVTLAVVMLVVNGIQYMFSDIPGIKVDAKNKLGTIVWGLILAFSSWLILYTINPHLVKFDLIKTIDDATQGVQGPPKPPAGGDAVPDGQFNFDNGPGGDIKLQVIHESSELSSLISCMANKVPGNVGRISSISDSQIISGQKTFAQCAQGECSVTGHRAGSHHYGGQTCVGKSYAVDFGDQENSAALLKAARECNSAAQGSIHNNNHVHISVGEVAGCGPGE